MKKLKHLLQSNWFYVLLILLCSGYCFYFTKIIKYHSKYNENTTSLEGKIISYTIDGDKLSLLLKNKEKIKVTYTIKSKEEKEKLQDELKIGATLALQGKKGEITPVTIPNTFNYEKYLYNNQIYFTFFAEKIRIKEDKIALGDQLKNRFIKRIKELDNNPYLSAFILGDKTSIDEQEFETITSNGISHLFALSGMHISLIYLILEKLLKKVKRKKGIIYCFLIAYLILTGMSVSFLRALLFMFLLDLNKLLNWNLSKIKILLLTAFLLILKNPFYVYHSGFWFTFIVTFSLLYCNEEIRNANKIISMLKVSFITFSFSLPISIYMNYEFNLLAILNNVLFVPLVSTLIFPLALLTFFFPLALPLFKLSMILLNRLNEISLAFSISIVVGKIEILEILFYYIFLLLLIKRKNKKYGLILIIFCLLIYNKNKWDASYHVYYLDVGQGDATLLISPYRKEVLLIDTGGKINYSKEEWQKRNKEFDLTKNLSLFFKSLRIKQIDLLVLSHGDLDHIGYTLKLSEKIKIKNVLLNKGTKNIEEQEIEKKLKVVNNYAFKKFDVEFLKTKLYDNENDNSTILKIKIEKFSFLFTGDASKKVEKALLKENIKATFLKLGHHGSKTSSDELFLKKVNPSFAIISSGRNNRYNHPSTETVEVLNKLKIKNLNTQDKGTLHIKINRNQYHIIPTIT